LQVSNLKINFIKFITTELQYSESNKLRYFFKCLKKGFFQGFSSGLFATLVAAKENPQSQLIISGIGLQDGGGHFYTSKDHEGFFSKNETRIRKNKFRNTNRKKVELLLFQGLKQELKKNIFSTNNDFCKLADISHFECNKINNFRDKIL
jgi:hypothetical protein